MRLPTLFPSVLAPALALVLAGPEVEIAQRIDGAPVVRLLVHQPDVLLDGSIEPSLAKILLRPFECGVSIDGHWVRLLCG